VECHLLWGSVICSGECHLLRGSVICSGECHLLRGVSFAQGKCQLLWGGNCSGEVSVALGKQMFEKQ